MGCIGNALTHSSRKRNGLQRDVEGIGLALGAGRMQHDRMHRRQDVQRTAEHPGMADGPARNIAGIGRERLFGARAVAVLAGKEMKRHQVGDHHAVGVGRRIVVSRLCTYD